MSSLHDRYLEHVDGLAEDESFPVYFYSYFKYNNEQKSIEDSVLHKTRIRRCFEIITFNIYVILRITLGCFRYNRSPANHVLNRVVFYENDKYLDVTDEILKNVSSDEVYMLNRVTFINDHLHINIEFFREVCKQIKLWRSLKHSVSHDLYRVLRYIFYRELINISLMKSCLKNVHGEFLYTTNYVSEISIILGERFSKVVAFKRGITGVGPELSAVGVDVLFVKDTIEENLFCKFRLSDRTDVRVANFYSEFNEAVPPSTKLLPDSLLFLTQPCSQYFNKHQQIQELQYLVNTCCVHKLVLIIKPHPNDKFNYSRWIKEVKSTIEIIVEYDLNMALHRAEYAVTKFSGTGIYFDQLGKPLFLLERFHDYPQAKNYYRIAEVGFFVPETISPHSFASLIRSKSRGDSKEILKKPDLREFKDVWQ